MAKQSAGILLYRNQYQLEVFLVHPGGPFWAKKDKGVWSLPKGEFGDEDPLEAAKREFKEETGHDAPDDVYTALESVKMSSGKVIYAWAVQGDLDPATLKSNTFKLEWPPKSGEEQDFPEVDKSAWFAFKKAYDKIHPSQAPFLDRLATELGADYSLPEQGSLF